jgi:RNA 3'-terminal phosphate cyclase (ATP)
VTAIVSRLPPSIGERECRTIAEQTDWPGEAFQTVEVTDSPGPGNVVLIELESPEVTEVFVGFGQRGVRAEIVAQRAWDETRGYLESGAPVGPHLADQLVLLLAISAWHGGGGGAFRTSEITGHTETHLELVTQLLGVRTAIDPRDDGTAVVRIGPADER